MHAMLRNPLWMHTTPAWATHPSRSLSTQRTSLAPTDSKALSSRSSLSAASLRCSPPLPSPATFPTSRA
ncbi:unnamed protein product [Symbiodinium sp. CCMP2592]|nr:unnamed protein product [Symbiodinium sp. CCMP2592]